MNIPGGQKVIVSSYIGYETRFDTFNFPLATNDPIEILLYSEGEELEGVVVSSTRSSRTIGNIPMRMETISGEELDEKGNIKPGDIRMILNEKEYKHNKHLLQVTSHPFGYKILTANTPRFGGMGFLYIPDFPAD